MRIESIVLILMLLSSMTQPLSLAENSGDGGVTASIGVETPIPGYRCYRGYNFTVEAVIHNGLEESVNVSVEIGFEPFRIVWTNYSLAELESGSNIIYTWILGVPRNISYGNYTLGLNITYTFNSTIYSMYREAWVEIIPRNVSLLVADLTHNTTGYYLVVRNPTTDPGQYVVENLTVTITAYNVSVVPHKVFVKKLYANNSYMIPLTISFNESDIGGLTVNITTHDDVHGLVYFNYTFIVVNATARLDLYVINDYGEPLPRAIVKIANGTYHTDSNGHVSLVLPVGIYNYTVEYQGHKVLGRMALYTGYNRYTIVVDLTPPIIVSIKQRGYGIVVTAYDPGVNASGINTIILFISGNRGWSYKFYPARNISIKLYPPLETGYATLMIIDSQGNSVNSTFYYTKPNQPNTVLEVLIVFSIVLIVIVAVLVLPMIDNKRLYE